MMIFVRSLDGRADVHDTAFAFDISNNEIRIEQYCA